jgi:hypothetical protein
MSKTFLARPENLSLIHTLKRSSRHKVFHTSWKGLLTTDGFVGNGLNKSRRNGWYGISCTLFYSQRLSSLLFYDVCQWNEKHLEKIYFITDFTVNQSSKYAVWTFHFLQIITPLNEKSTWFKQRRFM